MKDPPHYVTADGGIWRLKSSAYRALVKAIQNGVGQPDLDDYGPMIGKVEELNDIVELAGGAI